MRRAIIATMLLLLLTACSPDAPLTPSADALPTLTPVPLAEPPAFRVVDRRVESNTAALVLLTPITFTLDACWVTCAALGSMGGY